MKHKTSFKRNLSTVLVFPLLLFFMSCEEEDAFLDPDSSTQPKDCLVDGCNLCYDSPTLVGSITGSFYQTVPDCNDVHVDGDIAYITAEGGLWIVNIRDVENPFEVGFFSTHGSSYRVFAHGNHVYLADQQHGMRIIEVSDPEHPSEAGFYQTDFAVGIFVEDNHAFVADGFYGLYILDVSDPENPLLVGQYPTPGHLNDVFVRGDHAFLCDGTGGNSVEPGALRILDVSDVTNPREIGSHETPADAWSIFVSGDYAYVADYNAHIFDGCMLIFDIGDPENPQQVGLHDSAGEAYDVMGDGNYVFLSDGGLGLRILDVSDAENPSEIGFYENREARGTFYRDGYIYMADIYDGLLIVSLFCDDE